jgi:hypothetical protein
MSFPQKFSDSWSGDKEVDKESCYKFQNKDVFGMIWKHRERTVELRNGSLN